MKKAIPVLLLFAATACGPTVPILASFKQGAANIFFGQPSPAPPPPPPLNANPLPNFPAALGEPVPEFAVQAPPGGACPEPAPNTFPNQEAPEAPSSVPPKVTAKFRYKGQKVIDPGKPDQKILTLPDSGTRSVTDVTGTLSPFGYQFSIVENYNGFKTTTAYESYPSGPAPSEVPGEAPAAGLYIKQITTTNADGSTTDSFTPASPVEIFPYPASPGLQYQGAGTDPLTQETFEIDPNGGTVDGRDRVNACGNVLDSWHATINGRLVNARGGPGGVTVFNLQINVATQFGSVIIADHLVEHGTDSNTGIPFNYDVQSWIDGLG